MKIKTNVNAGGLNSGNHNQTGLKVATKVKAAGGGSGTGGINHNQTRVR